MIEPNDTATTAAEVAQSSSRTGRRSLFGAGAAMLAGAGLVGTATAATPSNPDAQLLALHQDLARADEATKRWGQTEVIDPEKDDAECDRLLAWWWGTYDQIELIRAKTPEGLRAKADVMRMVLERTCLTKLGETIADIGAEQEPHERFAWSLAQDVLAVRS